MWICPTTHMQTCRFNSNMEYPLANRYWGCSLIKKNLLHIFPNIDVCMSVSTNLWESSANSDGSPILSTHHITQQLFFFLFCFSFLSSTPPLLDFAILIFRYCTVRKRITITQQCLLAGIQSFWDWKPGAQT